MGTKGWEGIATRKQEFENSRKRVGEAPPKKKTKKKTEE